MFSFLKRQKNERYDQAGLAAALVNVVGQISKKELFTLYSHALQLRQRAVAVEIGSFKGKSAVALGLGAQRVGARVYCIDPHDPFIGVAGGVFGPGDLKDKIRHIHTFDLGDVVFPICLSSTRVAEIWDKPVDLLWIDGDHTYEFVSKDFLGFSPHVVPGGVIILHDREMEGVAKLISEIDSSVFESMNTVDAMAIYRKR
jgi:predicted O-methyltransferase YrrM